jgi:hypothetical protein
MVIAPNALPIALFWCAVSGAFVLALLVWNMVPWGLRLVPISRKDRPLYFWLWGLGWSVFFVTNGWIVLSVLFS